MNARTRVLTAAVLGVALLAPAPGRCALTAQQQRMKDCNTDASGKSLKGPDRSAFMKTCLAAKQQSQQEKMKTCNQEASTKSLKGYDRKHFMSTCLSAHQRRPRARRRTGPRSAADGPVAGSQAAWPPPPLGLRNPSAQRCDVDVPGHVRQPADLLEVEAERIGWAQRSV